MIKLGLVTIGIANLHYRSFLHGLSSQAPKHLAIQNHAVEFEWPEIPDMVDCGYMDVLRLGSVEYSI